MKKRNFFPPGAIRLDSPPEKGKSSIKMGVRSPWREFEFWFMVVQQAVFPRLSVNSALENWNEIKIRLMEKYRQRNLQTDFLFA